MLMETALDIPQDYEIENPFVLPTQGNAESILPPLPSYIGVDRLQELGLKILVDQELSLRQGQANDCLHEIRLALADKSMIFQQDVRHARNYNLMTQAWGQIASMDLTLNRHASLYCRCRQQMATLGADADILIRYQELHASDLSVTTAISDPNARGHRDDRLAWFCTMSVPCLYPVIQTGMIGCLNVCVTHHSRIFTALTCQPSLPSSLVPVKSTSGLMGGGGGVAAM